MSDGVDTRRARDVVRRHRRELLRRPGVVSVGVGLAEDGGPVIFVGLLSAEAAEALEVPREIEGVPVVARVVGQLEARE